MSKKLKSRGWLLGKPRVYSHARSDSTGSLVIGSDIEELLQLEILCKELRNERDRLQTSLLMEQSKNCDVIKSKEAEVDELNKTWEKDKKRFENLGLELKNFSDRQGHFQEEKEVKNAEANLVAGHILNLDMKLAGSDKLHEKINHLREELAKSEADRLGLKQELEDKNNILQDTVDCMNWSEEHISTNSMKFEHEMQIMRQELVMSEQRCIIAKNDSEKAAKEVKQKVALVKDLKDQLEKAEQTICCLQKGLQFQKYLENSEVKIADFCHYLQEHFDQWLSRECAMKHDSGLESDNNVEVVGQNQLLLDKQSSSTRSDEDLELFFSKLVTVKNMEKSHEDVGSMTQQLSQLQATVSQLKEELREEKKKAKEEAEDMTQEMAELRYQLMEMLEQERELRARTEQASLHRVEELEAEKEEETKNTLIAIENCHKAEKVAEAKAKEIEKLKLSLDVMKLLEEQLRNSQDREVHLHAKCSELESQVDLLNEKLGAAEQEIQAGIEHHVEALLQYEEEYSWMKAEADATKKSLADQLAQLEKALAEKTAVLDAFQEILAEPSTASIENERHGPGVKEPKVTLERLEENLKHKRQFHTEAQHNSTETESSLEDALCKLAVANTELNSAKKEIERLQLIQHEIEKQLLVHMKEIDGKEISIKKLQDAMLEKDKLSNLQSEELRSLSTENKKLLNHVASLVSEIQSLQQSLLSSQSVIEELKFQLQNTQEAAAVERRRASKFEEDARCKTEKIARQNEMLVQSQLKFNNLHKKFTHLQAELNSSQRKEKDSVSLVERLNLELTVAKEEVVNSEVRMQKVLKQAKEQLDSERRRHEELISSYKQAEWFMNREVENDRKTEKVKL